MPTVRSELRRLRREDAARAAASAAAVRDDRCGTPRHSVRTRKPLPSPINAHHRGSQRVLAWMAGRGWKPWDFQQQAWAAYARGESGLINVPTGAGKTYAAYLGPLAELLDGPTDGLAVLFVTPLRAVSRDIDLALRAPVHDLAAPISIGSRTGDTKASVRARQRERLPNVLVTTPESLSLLLAQGNAAALFSELRCVIIDEWHELLSTKRGTQVELALARLRGFRPAVRTWALSATIANIDKAARAAAGTRADTSPTVIRAAIDRPIIIESLLPPDIRTFPWAGHMGMSMLEPLLEWLDPARSTLVFTNTRSQAEKWYQAIRWARPEWHSAGWVRLHHGSIDRAERERVEAGLKKGDVRIVVATSSLDLGVDFAPVERVVQIGSPKGVSRLMQRAGRSGHRPGETCRVLCVPTHALELVEIAAARRAVRELHVEPRLPIDRPLDVLVQHLVTCALGGGFTPDSLFDEVRSTAAFAALTRAEFDWALDLVERGGATLRAYPMFHRIAPDPMRPGVYHVPNRRIGQIHRLNIGTITAEATVNLRYLSGRRLGSIEEGFVSRLREGERFYCAGKVVEFVRMEDADALVRPARGRTSLTPIWGGTRLPISESLGESVREALGAAGGSHSNGDSAEGSPELTCFAPVAAIQKRLSAVPRSNETLVEITQTREGHHIFVYPFDGRLVHGGMAALLAYRLSRPEPRTFTTASNDYGFELLSTAPIDLTEELLRAALSPEGLMEDAAASVNLGEMARRQFREVARVAGLVVQSFPGAPKTGRQLQVSSGLLYDVMRDFDPDNLLMVQSRREVLERMFEQSRLARTLARVSTGPLRIVSPKRPTPLALPLVVERIGAHLSTESVLDRIERMRRAWEA
ncbi:MAG: ligase-associated DNA damage response DEXH box helicase [Phycisphaeraceae bacterium]|nr:ligase-associated DNA damage response DEXH box helicase [Phycisphaeraceae bacterium]